MNLKKDSSYLLIKMNSPENISFLKEHCDIINKAMFGFVDSEKVMFQLQK